MIPLSVLARVLGLRFRAAVRSMRDRAFFLFVLGPIVLGGVGWSLDRWIEAARDDLARWMVEAPGVLGRVLALGLTLVFTERARRALHRTPEPWLAVLGVREGVRWLETVAVLAAEGVAAALGLAVFLGFLTSSFQHAVAALPLTLAAAVPVVLLALPLAALRVRWRLGNTSSAALAALLLATASIGSGGAADVLLAPWVGAAVLLEGAVGLALSAPAAPVASEAALAASLAGLGALAVGGALHGIWGRRDLERAGARIRPRRTGPSLLRPVGVLQALVVRDLRRIGRGYSTRVPAAVALALGLLFLLAVPAVRFAPHRAGGVALGAALVLVALVPGLLAREEASVWNDRVFGVEEGVRLRAKLALGGLLGLGPALLAGALVGASHGPLRGLAVVLALLLGATVSTAAAFELPDEPGLAAAWGMLLGGAVASLVLAVPEAWWLWTLLGGAVVGKLLERGSLRLGRPRELR